MAALKVSLSFLDEPVHTIITKAGNLARLMTNNDLYKYSPISADGLKTAVEHLKEMEKKAKSKLAPDIESCRMALGDVDDFVRQIAEFINHSSDSRKLTDNGFDFTAEVQKINKPLRVNWSGGLI